VSLRREIHSAFDVIAPPLGGMPERVVQTVLADKRRRRKENVMVRLRVPLSLVAVFIAIALIAAVLVGGRVIHDWNLFRYGTPAGGAAHATLAELEARSLQVPQVAASAHCPDGPTANGLWGNGPFYGDPALGSQNPTQTGWGAYWDLVGLTDRNVTGLMLVRAIDARTQQPLVFVGQYAAGSSAGTDDLGGQTVQQRAELVLDTNHAPHTSSGGRTEWRFTVGMPNGNSGCYAWQIDGDAFTETFVFNLNSN
jgi:hypothetical protein